MSSLARFGRRQAKRLHSLTARLSARQKLGLLVVAVICALVAIASVAGQVGHRDLAAGRAAGREPGRRGASVPAGRRSAPGQPGVGPRSADRRGAAAAPGARGGGEGTAVGRGPAPGAHRHHRERRPADPGRRGADAARAEPGDRGAGAALPEPHPAGADAGRRARPTDLLGLLHIVRRRKPKLSIVLGAGPSVVWLGYALEKLGRLVVVEHDAEQVTQVRALLKAHGLGAVEVRHAPLTELAFDGRTVDWYDVDTLDGLQDVDLLRGGRSHRHRTRCRRPCTRWAAGWPRARRSWSRRRPRTAPRQGGFEGLTAERRLIGKYTALSYTPAMTTALGRERRHAPAAGDGEGVVASCARGAPASGRRGPARDLSGAEVLGDVRGAVRRVRDADALRLGLAVDDVGAVTRALHPGGDDLRRRCGSPTRCSRSSARCSRPPWPG